MKFTLAAAVFFAAILALSPDSGQAQEVVDKTVATVSDGVRTELITYSDLRWQLALQPGVQLVRPSSEDLNQALSLLTDQKLFALEAERVPREAPTDAEIKAKIAEILQYFPSAAAFEQRLRTVGFKSIDDPNFIDIIRQRVAIEKYIDFRFRSFIVVTAEDEANYYREIWVPDFQRRNPGAGWPTLDAMRPEINRTLTEQRVAEQIQTFLDEARRRAQIVIISPV